MRGVSTHCCGKSSVSHALRSQPSKQQSDCVFLGSKCHGAFETPLLSRALALRDTKREPLWLLTQLGVQMWGRAHSSEPATVGVAIPKGQFVSLQFPNRSRQPPVAGWESQGFSGTSALGHRKMGGLGWR